MNDSSQTTTETGATDTLGQKTTLSRLKDALKSHITIDNDWSAAIKIKKQADPVVRALMQHDPPQKQCTCAKTASFSQHPTPIY